MSDAGIEAADEGTHPSDEDSAVIEARVAALRARFPARFTAEEIAAIRSKVAEHVATAKALHGAPLDPAVEPPPFLPYLKPEGS